jgi:hypothetical protein
LSDRLPEKSDRDLLEELWSLYEHASTDAAYWQSKYDGTWPSEDDDEMVTPHEARRRLWSLVINGICP